ncbi:ABC transporter ATP-binding protein [Kozakia baliensis]|uniref:ABC transporter n=1 Tax=Kozakia baliensis TaxID=153496 RepID=A0A1D8UXP0_9PROT|nr:ABC transporter ATP-binding protein [Kozakia baliensis]AOX18400.1 ABC transporter [Kozakia baliensis]GBR34166.1 nitrate/sulfonate/bicarbonate transporter ATP-binding protein [Kozakia baliensis NRIC 0488]GEL65161.1 ABC transporter ATP-binding protein [Kozakia baliensis]
MVETRTDPKAYLVAQGLSKHYPGAPRPSVLDASFTLERGTMLMLLGPSGCGKTTLLRLIAGLESADSGTLRVNGRDMGDVPLHRRGMGMVFQSYALFPHLSVARNISFGLEVRGMPEAAQAKKLAEMLALTHLEGLEHRRIGALSGGQRQRVALARALAVEPDVLLLDEPLANLDVKLRETMRAEIRSVQKRLGVTSVFVTHDQDEALSTADLVAVMSAGRIHQIGTPTDIYERPIDRFVASFVGRGNFLPARRAGMGRAEVAGLGFVPIRAGESNWTGERMLLVRPHHIAIDVPSDSDAFRVSGEVRAVQYTGERHTLEIAVGPHLLTVEAYARPERTPRPGQAVALSWKAADVTVLTDETA